MVQRTNRATLTDVARRSAVSTAAASYVLNDRRDKTIPQTTRDRVLRAASELGYVPNAAAAALRRGRTNVVLVVVDATFVGEVSARTTEKLTAGISALGYTVLIHTWITEDRLLEVVQALQPFGVLLLTFVPSETRDRLKTLGASHVAGYEPSTQPGGIDRFWEADIGAAQVRHLAERGHQIIAYAMTAESPRLPVAQARLAGAEAECSALDLKPPLVVAWPLDRAEIASSLTRLRDVGVTAVCADSDRMGIAVLAALTDLGWSVPSEMAVIGADNDVESALSTPPLTTTWIADRDYGAHAASWFQAVMDGQHVDPIATLQAAPSLTNTIERQST